MKLKKIQKTKIRQTQFITVIIVKVKIIIIKERKTDVFHSKRLLFADKWTVLHEWTAFIRFLLAYKNNKVTITCNHSL